MIRATTTRGERRVAARRALALRQRLRLSYRRLTRWMRGSGAPVRSVVLDETSMQRLLVRERARSDRMGYCFSVVAITCPTRRLADQFWKQALSAMGERLRITDQVGWLRKDVLGIFLPDAAPEAAWKVARELRNLLREASSRPEFSVYAYPSEWDELVSPTPGTVNVDGAVCEVRKGESLFCRKPTRGKRALDVTASAAALLFLSPLLLLTAALVKLTSRGPALFKQQRIGLGGQPFVMLKFRTMVVNAEELQARLRAHNEQEGPAFKMKHDPRVTGLGRWLRRTCVDELPQLWNVLRGEMSIVGPRPLPTGETKGCDGWQRERLDVLPGLTCLWQTQRTTRVAFADWMRMDIRYARGWRFVQDVKLIFRTMWCLVRRRVE